MGEGEGEGSVRTHLYTSTSSASAPTGSRISLKNPNLSGIAPDSQIRPFGAHPPTANPFSNAKSRAPAYILARPAHTVRLISGVKIQEICTKTLRSDRFGSCSFSRPTVEK